MPAREPLDLLAFHAYLLREDRYRSHVIRPYPPLSPGGLIAYLRHRGWHADQFDPTIQPDLTGFEVTLSRLEPRVAAVFGHPSTRETVWRMVATARRAGCLVLAFGDDPTAVPELYLDHGVDVVIRGEAELTVERLLGALRDDGHRLRPATLRGLTGVSWRDGDAVLYAPETEDRVDLDRVPPALRGEIETAGYLERQRALHGAAEIPVLTARSVPGAPGYRRRRAAAVADEIEQLRRQFTFDQVRFVDHVFTDDLAWHRRFAAALERRGGPVPYTCFGRIQDIGSPLLETMRDTGCERIAFDVATGSSRLLRQLDRGYAIEDVYRVARQLRETGISMGVLVSLGLEGERREDILATIDMLNVLEPDVWGVTLEDPEIAAEAHELHALGLPGMRTLRHGWPDPERRDGRRLPVGFYRWALRLLTADTYLHRLKRQGHIDGTGVGMAVARPLYRAMVRAYPVRGR